MHIHESAPRIPKVLNIRTQPTEAALSNSRQSLPTSVLGLLASQITMNASMMSSGRKLCPYMRRLLETNRHSSSSQDVSIPCLKKTGSQEHRGGRLRVLTPHWWRMVVREVQEGPETASRRPPQRCGHRHAVDQCRQGESQAGW